MKKYFIHSLSVGAVALAICTLIYAATDSRIVEITNKDQLESLLAKNPESIIEFYSPTCPVCNAFKKEGIFERAAQALPSVAFAVVSHEEGRKLHDAYRIEYFPTFIYFKDGKEIKRSTGYTTNPKFTQNIKDAFSTNK